MIRESAVFQTNKGVCSAKLGAAIPDMYIRSIFEIIWESIIQ